MKPKSVVTNVTSGNFHHRWVDVRLGTTTIQMSRYPLMVDGVFVAVTGKQAKKVAKLMGAKLPTSSELDAHYMQADIKLDPTPEAELDVVTSTDEDLTKSVLVRLPNNWRKKSIAPIGKHWCRHPRRYPLYGWQLGPDTRWRGKTYPSQSIVGGKVIQPYWTKAHNGDHIDYSMTLMLVRDKSVVPEFNSLGEAVLYCATEDLERGVMETKPNDGPAIRTYAEMYDLTPPLNWCAVAVGTWIRNGAYLANVPPPIKGSPGAQATMAQFIRAGLWVPRGALSPVVCKPGNIIVWKRPPKTWTGHIGVIEKVNDDGTLTTIEGNSGPKGDRVYRNPIRRLTDPLLLGVGRLDTTEVRYEPTTYQLEEAARLMETSDAVWTCEKDPLDW